MKSFLKKTALKNNSGFFDSKLPYKTRDSLFIALLVLETQNWFILWREIKVWIYFFYKKDLNLKKIYIKSEQNHAKYPVFTQNFKPRWLLKKNEIQKIFFSFEFLAGWAFYWYHSLFSTMNISIGQNCLNKKNPFEYIVPPPTSEVETIISIWILYGFWSELERSLNLIFHSFLTVWNVKVQNFHLKIFSSIIEFVLFRPPRAHDIMCQ